MRTQALSIGLVVQCVLLSPFAAAAEPSADSPTLAYIESVKTTNVRHSGRTVSVSFDDGEQVPATKLNGPASYEVVGPLAEEYDALERAASSRGEVASALSRALRTCQDAPTSLEEANARAAHAPVKFADLFTRLFKQCDGVTTEQKAKADFWLAKAAELGDPIAALNYAEQLGNTAEAFPLWEAGWRAGYGDALASLARLYRDGRSTPPRRDPDHAKAYTYQYLYVRLMDAMSPVATPMGRIRARLLAEALDDLQSLERELSVGERDNAVTQAKAMLKANTNCCQPM